MSGMNMTLADYLDYASVYEYSQDHYDMERMFMELCLVDMHLKSYDFLREASDITIGKLDHLMVESGSSDRSYATEQIFVEKAGGILDGIKKLFSMIGKAISAFFTKLANIFAGGSNKSKETDKQTAQILQDADVVVQKADRVVDVAATIQDGRELLEDIVQSGQNCNEGFRRVLTRVDNLLGGGGVKVTGEGIDAENNSITPVLFKFNELSQKIPNFPKFDYNNRSFNVVIALCSDQYEVEAPAFIVDMDTIIPKLNELLDIKGEMGSEDNYNSFWKIVDKFGPEGMFERIQNIKDDIQRMAKQNKRMTVSAEILEQKRESAKRLADIFQKIINTSDIGVQDSGTIADTISNMTISDNRQFVKREQLTGDFKIRYDNDKSRYANRGIGPAKKIIQPLAKTVNYGKNREYYVRYLREIYQMAVELQHTTNDAIKLLTDHINVRNEAIKAKASYSDTLAKVINDVTKILNAEAQNGSSASGSGDSSGEGKSEEGGA